MLNCGVLLVAVDHWALIRHDYTHVTSAPQSILREQSYANNSVHFLQLPWGAWDWVAAGINYLKIMHESQA